MRKYLAESVKDLSVRMEGLVACFSNNASFPWESLWNIVSILFLIFSPFLLPHST